MVKMMALIRNERAKYYELWDCTEREWCLEIFLKVFSEAVSNNEKQHAITSNFTYALARGIKKVIEMYGDRNPGGDAVGNVDISKSRLIYIVGENTLDRSLFELIRRLVKPIKDGGDEYLIVVIEIINGDKSELSHRQ
jgi:hypothetical protein